LIVQAYVHKSIVREGLRDKLHLNPIPFETDNEILRHLELAIRDWPVLLQKSRPILLASARHTVTEGGYAVFDLNAGFRNGDRALQSFRLDVDFPFEFYVDQSSNSPKRATDAPGRVVFFKDEKNAATGTIYQNDSLPNLISFRYRIPADRWNQGRENLTESVNMRLSSPDLVRPIDYSWSVKNLPL
jgi:hypothetical protein